MPTLKAKEILIFAEEIVAQLMDQLLVEHL